MSEIPHHLPPGTYLRGDTYRIVRFIAAGGFGCTYEAEHVMLRKRIAIKEFFMQDYCNRDADTNWVTVGTQSMHELVDKYRQRFLDEARALSGLHHEGIVSVSDVFEENGTAYYVMDYVEGQSLSKCCKGNPLPEKAAIYYIRQVCEALMEVHDQGRLHLDIKPDNIMVKSDGRTLLIDFGTSKQFDIAGGGNTATTPVFTPGYAPLEQTLGDAKQYLPATDIYALGATLYALLTGRAPLQPAARLNQGEDLTFPDGISAATRHAVEKALEIRMNDRPQSVREFIALLDAAIRPTQAATQKASQPSAPPQKPIDPVSDTHKEHDFVDLGLSVMWATCNVGASTPEEYGNYYAWGETETKSEYTIDTSKTYNRKIGDIRGNSDYDTARANWGGNWRLPTKDECKELIDNCTCRKATQHGVKGMRFTSKKNGNSIFYPVAGSRYGSSLDYAGIYAYYLSSMPFFPNDIDTQDAAVLSLDLKASQNHCTIGKHSRHAGSSVRPVFSISELVDPISGSHNGHNFVDLGLSIKWGTCNVGASCPEEYGNYYAWGETKSKTMYFDSNCSTCHRKISDFSGNSTYDAARANWGGNWRQPTQAEFEELIDHCDRQWIVQNGVAGTRFTSKINGNCIFFPAAGSKYLGITSLQGEINCYWSSTPCKKGMAYICNCSLEGRSCTFGLDRWTGQPVRPVLD